LVGNCIFESNVLHRLEDIRVVYSHFFSPELLM
jgi:hypothetical protein